MYKGIRWRWGSYRWVWLLMVVLWGPGGVQADIIYQTEITGDGLTGVGGMLDYLYGWENLERVDDFGPGENDQYWTYTDDSGEGALQAQAKNTFFSLRPGVLSGETGWDFDGLTTLGFNKDGIYGETRGMPEQQWKYFDRADTGEVFRWGLDLPRIRGVTWSSAIADNASMPGGWAGDGSDHLVTWRIIGNTGFGDNIIGNYVLAWEDFWVRNNRRNGGGDYDDLVVEVSGVMPIPEPATVTIMLLGGLFVFRCHKMSMKRR